jgi:hypothetical protein
MKPEKGMQNLLLISALAGLFLLAIVFDIITRILTDRNSQMGGLDTTLVWMYPLLEMLWVLASLGLVWLMISSGFYSRWVSVIYLVVGLIILYTNPILFVTELPDSLYVVVQYLFPGTMLIQAGGTFAAIGILSMWFWKSPGDDSAEVELENLEATTDAHESKEIQQ